MSKSSHYEQVQEREFFAHHGILLAALKAIEQAEATELGRFNQCLAAITMTAVAVEALANAVGSRVVDKLNWASWERRPTHDKIDDLVSRLGILKDTAKEPWTSLRDLAALREGIVHAKPEQIRCVRKLPKAAVDKEVHMKRPESSLERQITLGNAQRFYRAVTDLKGLFADALGESKRYGIYADMYHGSISMVSQPY